MTDRVTRLTVVVLAVLVFVVAWALIAAHPWAPAVRDPRAAALDRRAAQLRADAVLVRRVVHRRWSAYYLALARRREQIAAAGTRARTVAAAAPAPQVRVVNLPPVTVTRTS